MAESSRTYYEILGVPKDADPQTIRKAYLRASLKYHPDKNPENVEEAKVRFVEIGQAYETLKDPQLRADYDRKLRSGAAWRYDFGSSSSSRSRPPSSSPASGGGGPKSPPNEYDTYRDAFDDFVSGMSEEELRTALGAAAIVGSVVGSLVGSRMMSSSSKKGGGGVLASLGSMAGSALASEAATNAVRALHQQSRQRVAYNEAVREAVARGEPPPEKPNNGGGWSDLLNKVMDYGSGGGGSAAAAGGGGPSSNHEQQQQQQQQQQQRGAADFEGSQESQGMGATWRNKFSDSINSAKDKAAAAVAATLAEKMRRDMGFNDDNNNNNNKQEDSFTRDSQQQRQQQERHDFDPRSPGSGDSRGGTYRGGGDTSSEYQSTTSGSRQSRSEQSQSTTSPFDSFTRQFSKSVNDFKDQAVDAVAKAAVANAMNNTKPGGFDSGGNTKRY